MRNHFLLQYLCTAAIFLSASIATAQDVTVADLLEGGIGAGSQPLVAPMTEAATEENTKSKSVETGQAIPLVTTLSNVGMVVSAGLLQSLIAEDDLYRSEKIACATAGDTAETLCIEGKSPQATIAKGIINAAGPALALSNSAQKTCSTAASTTNLAQQAMTLAKGACVGAKLICDNSCSKAAIHLKSIGTKLTAFFVRAEIEKEERAMAVCLTGITPPCEALMAVAAPLAVFKTAATGILKSDDAPLPMGTMNSLVLRCQGYSKDVALFATNILGLLAANKSANECKDKLASTGANPSAQEYCAIATNTSSTFCKCQKDQTAEGCPGHLAVTPTTSKETKDGKGNNLKSNGNANEFAGGFDKVKATPIDLGGLKSDSAATAAGDDKKADAGGGGFGTSAASGGGSYGGAGAGKGSDAKDAVAAEDKKKMGLGAFFGLGGGGSSGSGSGKSGNGSLGQKDMDAIQRQIASEKLRAEVSGASGKSNWEKVSERYLRNKSTLLVGQ